MRFDNLEKEKSLTEKTNDLTRHVALIISFITVFFFFIKIVFL
jgi:hypothetical protein